MSYKVILSKTAIDDISEFRKVGDKSVLRKIEALLEELKEHPYFGTGKPKPLGGTRTGQWSRRITAKHRLVYAVRDAELIVLVVAAAGHYDDKG
ncbi:MAG: Txe/YoeB family addiction module toxin [Prevotellaceae bacterium]|jgi:toxin YoeB|nr:Txe/YoeB family addiction module toxin [Prevotellaceae bacterium]